MLTFRLRQRHFRPALIEQQPAEKGLGFTSGSIRPKLYNCVRLCPVSALAIRPVRVSSRIRGKNTVPEVRLRRALHGLGLRYRIHSRELPGKPDIVFPKWKAVCFVHGCFWHRRPGCNLAATPSTRPTFWETKFSANVSRDVRNKDALKEAGWRVAIVWECSLGARNTEQVAAALADWLKRTGPFLEMGKPVDLRDASHR